MNINYRSLKHKAIRAAWFEYKKTHELTKKNLVSFVAGYNAAYNELGPGELSHGGKHD